MTDRADIIGRLHRTAPLELRGTQRRSDLLREVIEQAYTAGVNQGRRAAAPAQQPQQAWRNRARGRRVNELRRDLAGTEADRQLPTEET